MFVHDPEQLGYVIITSFPNLMLYRPIILDLSNTAFHEYSLSNSLWIYAFPLTIQRTSIVSFDTCSDYPSNIKPKARRKNKTRSTRSYPPALRVDIELTDFKTLFSFLKLLDKHFNMVYFAVRTNRTRKNNH